MTKPEQETEASLSCLLLCGELLTSDHYPAFEKDVLDQLLSDKHLPDLVCFAGNLAPDGKAASYDQVGKVMAALGQKLGHSPAQSWYVVPGPGDVDPSLIKPYQKSMRNNLVEDETAEMLADAETWSQYACRQAPFLSFTDQMLGNRRAWRSDKPWETRTLTKGNKTVAMLCLNSAWCCQDANDSGNILMGGAQVERALAEVGKQDLKIALFHHPLELLKPFDKELCSDLLFGSDGCQVVLHADRFGADLKIIQNPAHRVLQLQVNSRTVMLLRLGLQSGQGEVQAWTYRHKPGRRWAPTEIYDGMTNGIWSFSLRGKAARPTTRAPLVPPQYKTWFEKVQGRMEELKNPDRKLPLLKDVYVPLKTDWQSPDERQQREKQAQNQPSRRVLTELLSLPDSRFLVVVGEPGSGKTTFARFAAGWELAAAAGRLPLFLELKNFGEWLVANRDKGDRAENLLCWAGEMLADVGLTVDGLRDRVGRGKVLWLLDGLDEIFHEPDRLRAVRILDKWFSGRGGGDTVVITTRPHALEQPGLATLLLGHEQTRTSILPLDKQDQQLFLKKWYGVLYGEEEHLRGEALQQSLWETLERQDLVADLRSNPLMLGNIALLYHNGSTLPERRADLYRAVIGTLLESRFGARAGYGFQEIERMWRALMALARGMQERGKAREIGCEDYRRLMRQGFFPDGEPSALELEKLDLLAHQLDHHSGLLEKRAGPIYRFAHLGFQEYLAGRAFGQERQPFQALKEHLDKGHWREVVLLTAGFLFHAEVSHHGVDFLKELHGHARNTRDAGCLALALHAAAEAPSGAVPRELIERLRTDAVLMLETAGGTGISARIDLAAGLGRIGDPRLGMEKESRWVSILHGSFSMGANDMSSNEEPPHLVTISRDFLMGRYPVTNEEYRLFVKDGGYKSPNWWEGLVDEIPHYLDSDAVGKRNAPVASVSWHEAMAYCRWLTDRLSKQEWWRSGWEIRLPTEAEWEYVASGKQGRIYPWGNSEPTEIRANYALEVGETTPVGAYLEGKTPQGVLDMAGNVLEWCLDYWDMDAYKDRPEGIVDPVVENQASVRALRGGSWSGGGGDLRSAYRDGLDAGVRFRVFGFRCVCVCVAVPEHGH